MCLRQIPRLLKIAIIYLAGGFCSAAESDNVSHAEMIRAWDNESFARGKKLYESICITCHGTPTQEGTLPTSRPFWKEPFKNGSDPYSIYKTLSEGLGQMPAWTFLTAEQRYDTIHYIREAFVKPNNPTAYFSVDSKYLAGLPKASGKDLQPPAKRADQEPAYLRMDFGPALFWTLQVETNNIAYKGIAIRLDDGPGGISKGRAWIVYDHDTMRVAAAWTGEQFIDWRGIAFDGSHGTHASIAGDKVLVNPIGPGWANPETGRWEDPRFRGRDGKPYGPLPKEWAHFQGVYHHSNKVVVAYTVGEARVLELPSYENGVFARNFRIQSSKHELLMRVAPSQVPVKVAGNTAALVSITNGYHVLRVPSSETPLLLKVLIGDKAKHPGATEMEIIPEITFEQLTKGGPSRWNPPLATQGTMGSDSGPFAVDELVAPPDISNLWHTWMRFGGFDFFNDGRRAAICTWNGDVWIVQGIEGDLSQLVWKRIASGLFQPLGVKIIDGTIYVTCRDQIARLHDLNGDDEIDYIENFNNDHQVTEHFHEFAMGLQTDSEGNFYYAKSARHALPAIVPHHGTLIKVSKDGSRSEIIANGFRAANGVCVNEDGTFFVTDQEGHWTPKNRINLVRPHRFYGNMFGYHEQASSADQDMEKPLVWITNDMDRSPGELVRVTSDQWGIFRNSILNLSYGTGRIFLVPNENIGEHAQGGMVQLPIPDFPTGVMRGRFHPQNGHLYACGMYSWAGNQQRDGGFFRVRYTGKPAYLPIALQAQTNRIKLQFSDSLDITAATDTRNYSIKTWALQRSKNYGSKHFNEQELKVTKASLESNGRTIVLEIPELQPTWGMEIKANLRGRDGTAFSRTVHNTIHALGPEAGD